MLVNLNNAGNACEVCLWGEVLVLFSACEARRRGDFVCLYCLRGLPVGVARLPSLYWFACMVCLSGEILCSGDAGVACLIVLIIRVRFVE